MKHLKPNRLRFITVTNTFTWSAFPDQWLSTHLPYVHKSIWKENCARTPIKCVVPDMGDPFFLLWFTSLESPELQRSTGNWRGTFIPLVCVYVSLLRGSGTPTSVFRVDGTPPPTRPRYTIIRVVVVETTSGRDSGQELWRISVLCSVRRRGKTTSVRLWCLSIPPGGVTRDPLWTFRTSRVQRETNDRFTRGVEHQYR